ncbi:MAG: LCP family protein [Candidatus Nomurabacteria bacterium]|jgi:LCP family protein required for cell wall assembly|nr:LCP family protein [Candidatus Nomurabacteria bacterium]
MKRNASNIDGFIVPTPTRRRVTLDTVPKPKSNVRDGLLPPPNRRSPTLGSSVKTALAASPPDDWAGDLDSTLADLPGYDNIDSDNFIDNRRPNKKLVQKALRRAPKPPKKLKKKLIIIILLSLALLFGLVFGALKFLWPEDSLLGNWWDVFTSEPLKQDSNGRTNILLFGTAPVDYDGPLLSDTIMILSINQTDKTAFMVSLPRDLWVKHYCPNYALGTSAGRLNETYRCALEDDDEANEAAAAAEFQDKTGEILGLDVQYYAHLSWNGVIDIVNAVGGIDVTINSNNPDGVYDIATGIDFDNGETVHMDGHLALAFIRARGSAGGYGFEDSNFARERNQQLIIQALQKKALSVGTMTNPVTVVSFVQALGDNLRTNFRAGEVRTLARLLDEIDTNNLLSLPLVDDANGIYLVTNENINGASVVVPTAGTFDYSEIKQYIRESISSDPMVREKAIIDVLNGSDTDGLASAEADKLEDKGFRTGNIGNAEPANYGSVTVYQLSIDKPATAEALKEIYGDRLILSDFPFSYTTDADFVVIVG